MKTTTTTSKIAPASTESTWWSGETQIRFSNIPNHLARKPDGSKVSLASAYRYGLTGVNGIRLRRFRGAGNTWCTTIEELHRWQHSLTVAAGGDA